MRPVAVVGNLALDRRDRGPLRPGGGPFHAGRALRALGRRSLLVFRSAAGDRPALLPPLVWVHVAPLLRPDFGVDTLAALARGRRLSLDGQGLVRAPASGPLSLGAEYDPASLRSVSILKLSEEEAFVAAGGLEEPALRELGVPEVVVTLGSRGAIVCADGPAELITTRALPPESVDATGAGEAYAAAYLVARAGGSAPPAAARSAAAVVSDVLTERI